MNPSPSPAVVSLVMLLAGIGIPIMAALNANLGARIANPQAAALILFSVGILIAAIAVTMTNLPSLSTLGAVPWPYFLGGLFVAFYVLSITWAAPRIGVGNAVLLVLFGQLASAAIIDHFGAMGALQTTLSPTRMAGLALMGAGIVLAKS